MKKRLGDWREKLIDLSRANRLLNYRPRRGGAVQVVEEDPREIAGLVTAAKTLTFDPKREDDPPPAEGALRSGDLKLQTTLERERLLKVLLRLYRESRASIEEQGFNTLYLALGILEFTAPQDPRPFRAPLLLLPVELKRRGARADFRLKTYDDDPQVNPALLLKLRQDLGVEVSFREQEEPLDYETVTAAFRTALAGRAEARLEDEIHLGLFSFAKIPLYNDLVEHEETIGTHPITASLARGEAVTMADEEGAAGELPTPYDVEASVDPVASFQILDADSSQQAALLAARRGFSFVLQGPPGTGKSQTIANIIAEALAADRTVLFVSEKMAALEVVQRRLDRAGLGAFCLELHSRKANKREVVQSLAQAWTQWSEAAGKPAGSMAELGELQAILKDYVTALHEPRGAADYAAFEVLAQAARYRPIPECPFDLPEPMDIDRSRLKAIERRLRALTPLRAAVEPVDAHPWRAVRLSSLGVSTLDDVRRAVNRYASALDTLRSKAAAIAGLLQAPAPQDIKEAKDLAGFANLIRRTVKTPTEWITQADWAGLSPRVGAAVEKGVELAALRTRLLGTYEPGVFELDATRLKVRARPGGWVFGWWRRRSVRKELAVFAQAAEPVALQDDLDALVRARTLHAEVQAADGALRSAFGNEYEGVTGDFHDLASHREFIAGVRARWPARLDPTEAVLAVFRCEGHEPLALASDAFFSAWEESLPAHGGLAALLKLHGEAARLEEFERRAFDTLADEAETWLERLNDLPAWIAWQGARRDACADGLAPYLDAFDERSYTFRHLLDGWFRTYWRACADHLLQEVEVLRAFDGRRHESHVARFQQLDKDHQTRAQERVAAHLRAGVPHPNVRSVGDSEVGLLKREIGKQRRHVPTRVLLDRIPRLLRALKPCLMMSPLSVATYLPPGKRGFDLVVFDEASQICTEDGVGAIARGAQVIVAGDSKQLPPTRFFERRIEEDDEAPEDVLVDLPSILDECKAGPLPQIPLLWHYRSRDESLIDFSNRHFYDDTLVTFPNAARDAPDLGISFVQVEDGIYYPGPKGVRANPVEADRVAERVFEILASRPEDSVGVVTFSTTQRDAVLDAIDARRGDGDPFADRFDGEALEPVFVKNLESVQGDERDVILFSVGYGHDPEGVLRLNFGPLNKEGGDRRLNVAVTRARKQVVVYSSIPPEEIDLDRAKGRGARLLRAYLETARRGMAPAAEARPVHDEEAFEADALAETVRRELVAKGFDADAGVGNSEFKVDLAVRHPDHAGRYVLAILCDGPAYAGAATTRDRERTRVEALGRLGWRVHRIWAPDWVRAPGRELDRIASAVDEARSAGVSAPAVPAEPAEPQAGVTREDEEAGTQITFDEEADLPGVEDYRAANLRPRGPAAEYHVVPLGRVSAALQKVIEAEGPLHVDLAVRRLAVAWGITRTTGKVVERFEEAAVELVEDGKALRRGEFLYPVPEQSVVVRRPAAGVERRLEEIPPEELSAAVLLVVESYLGIAPAALLREVARVFGYQRMSDKALEVLDPIVGDLLARGRLVAEGDRITSGTPVAETPAEAPVDTRAEAPAEVRSELPEE